MSQAKEYSGNNDFSRKMAADVDTLALANTGKRLHHEVVSAVEKPLIERVLGITEGNKSQAARMLGINRNTLNTKIKRLAIDERRFRST